MYTKVEFQGDALSDAEKNDIRETVMGKIILKAIPPAEGAKAIQLHFKIGKLRIWCLQKAWKRRPPQ